MLLSMTSYKPLKMANISREFGDSTSDSEKLRKALIWLSEHAECTYNVWHKTNYTELECSMPFELVDDFKTALIC